MVVEQKEPVYNQVRNLLAVLLLGALCAGGLAAFMLYYYGPTGIYKFKNVVASPQLVDTSTLEERNAQTGKVSRLAFDKIEFSYWSSDSRQLRKVSVSLDAYRSFYEKFADDTSLANRDEQLAAEFLKAPPALLALTVRLTGGHGATSAKVFQEIQFANDGDLYRVTLNEENPTMNWAYFTHPGVYREVMAIFTGSEAAP